MNANPQPDLIHEAISARARELWRIAGRPRNRDLEFWLAAQARVERERAEIDRAVHELPDAGVSAA